MTIKSVVNSNTPRIYFNDLSYDKIYITSQSCFNSETTQ